MQARPITTSLRAVKAAPKPVAKMQQQLQQSYNQITKPNQNQRRPLYLPLAQNLTLMPILLQVIKLTIKTRKHKKKIVIEQNFSYFFFQGEKLRIFAR